MSIDDKFNDSAKRFCQRINEIDKSKRRTIMIDPLISHDREKPKIEILSE